MKTMLPLATTTKTGQNTYYRTFHIEIKWRVSKYKCVGHTQEKKEVKKRREGNQPWYCSIYFTRQYIHGKYIFCLSDNTFIHDKFQRGFASQGWRYCWWFCAGRWGEGGLHTFHLFEVAHWFFLICFQNKKKFSERLKGALCVTYARYFAAQPLTRVHIRFVFALPDAGKYHANQAMLTVNQAKAIYMPQNLNVSLCSFSVVGREHY